MEKKIETQKNLSKKLKEKKRNQENEFRVNLILIYQQ